MAVRIGLGLTRGTPRWIGIALVAVAGAMWVAGFSVIGALLTAVATTILFERRRSSARPAIKETPTEGVRAPSAS